MIASTRWGRPDVFTRREAGLRLRNMIVRYEGEGVLTPHVDSQRYTKVVKRYLVEVRPLDENEEIPDGEYTLEIPDEILHVRKIGEVWEVLPS